MKKADKKRKLKARKHKKSCSKRRSKDSDSSDISAPKLRSESMYGDDCKLNQKLDKDYQESYKQITKPDERFDEKNMFRDNIKEYDTRNNDERVNDDCTDICKNEDLGSFVSSEIQDILRKNFLFKCTCSKGTTDWYLYDNKTNKSRPLSSTSGLLLDGQPEEAGCTREDIPYPPRETREIDTTARPVLTAPGAPKTSADCETTKPVLTAPVPAPSPSIPEPDDESEDEEDADDVSKCGSFVSKNIDAAKRRAKGCGDDKIHSDLGECFNKFIENKFDKLHRRLNKIKNKNTNYVQDLHRKQLRKQKDKIEDIVDKTGDNVCVPQTSGTYGGGRIKSGDSLRNIQENMNDLKKDLKLNCSEKKQTPEDVYFQSRNAKDQDCFNQRLQSRFDGKSACDDSRFATRFGNVGRYSARDESACGGTKQPTNLKADSGAFISDEVGRIKTQNTDYLSKIKNMFGGGCE